MKPSSKTRSSPSIRTTSPTIRSRASCFATLYNAARQRTGLPPLPSTSWRIRKPGPRSRRSPHRDAWLHPRRRHRPPAFGRSLSADPQERKTAALRRVRACLQPGIPHQDEMEMRKDGVAAGEKRHPRRRPERQPAAPRKRRGRQAACARSAPRSSPPASSSTCRISAAAPNWRRWGCRWRRLIGFEGH